MDERIARIRENERKSHIETYTNQVLYEGDSWLKKPIQTVQEIVLLFEMYNELRVLDLGCGIGRNCIYIAEKFKDINCRIDCVDLLEVAIDKLLINADEHDVLPNINAINDFIEEFDIESNAYDFIMAISALEHIDTEDAFVKKLIDIRDGVRENGIVCLVINTNVTEINPEKNEIVEAQFEINLETERVYEYLKDVFKDWKILKNHIVDQEYNIPRETFISCLRTSVITYVVRKN